MTTRSGLICDDTFVGDGEFGQDYFEVLCSAKLAVKLRIRCDLFIRADEAFLGCISVATTCLHLVVHTIDEIAKFLEVRVGQEILILDEVFHLVPVVGLERLMLQLLQVPLVELGILHVLCVGWLEELFELAPLETVTQL